MFRKILFPVDLTANMQKISPYVIEMADKFGSEIHCVYSLYVGVYYAHIGMPSAYVADFEGKAQIEVEAKLNHFIAETFKGRNVRSQILNGRPGDQIIDYARENGIELIVMGHSTTGIERAVLGSVAGHVVKYAPVPVMLISPEVLKE